MKITNWGNYPVIDARVYTPSSVHEITSMIHSSPELIARGLGRCYGDSSLGPAILSTVKLNHFIAFDEQSGRLTCEAGVSLAEILDVLVKRGWFLPVTPGTKFVTIGGAIASDVHGKNHHSAGSFSRHVESMKVLLADGSMIHCSRSVHDDLFWATCGGMGLTGIIVEATLTLLRIETAYIRQQIVKSRNIEESIELFEEYKHWTYSVAWIDCLASGKSLGRSALILGEHATNDEVGYRYRDPLNIDTVSTMPFPFFLPSGILNQYTVKLFNEIRYSTYRQKESLLEYEPFFYPLDAIGGWNKIYGKRGFTQYQCVLPKERSRQGLTDILKMISHSGDGSFLAVLKLFGKQEGLLSFPLEGYTLALDFTISERTLKLFNELDRVVLDSGGRLYLSKDVRMTRPTFELGYPNVPEFQSVRKKYGAHVKFQSLQSKRIGL